MITTTTYVIHALYMYIHTQFHTVSRNAYAEQTGNGIGVVYYSNNMVIETNMLSVNIQNLSHPLVFVAFIVIIHVVQLLICVL